MALQFADDVGVLRVLLKAGADLNAADHDGRTTLLNFAEAADAQGVRILVKMGADVTATNANGDTAMTLATKSNDRDLVSALKGV